MGQPHKGRCTAAARRRWQWRTQRWYISWIPCSQRLHNLGPVIFSVRWLHSANDVFLRLNDLYRWRWPSFQSVCPRYQLSLASSDGKMESMALMPVCRAVDGFFEVLRAPCFPQSGFCRMNGPFPSMGWPRALTTRPMSSGPTGTYTPSRWLYDVSLLISLSDRG
jgi:hypothetical protein